MCPTSQDAGSLVDLDGYQIVVPEHEKATKDQHQTANRNVTVIALFASLGGLLYGYDTGIISSSMLQITEQWHLNSTKQEIITTAILVGAVIGAFISGRSSKKFGRRKTILTIALVFMVGVISAALSVNGTMLSVCRLFLGMAVGGASQIIPTYIAELAPAHKRGQMVTMFNISIGIGIFLADLAGRLFVSYSWRYLMGIAAVPALILAYAMLRLPETPRWLIEQGSFSQARAVLRHLRPTKPAAVSEAMEIWDNAQNDGDAEENNVTLRSKWVRPALIAGLGVAAFTQLSGLEMMIYYAPTLLTEANLGKGFALNAGVGIGLVYLIFTIIGENIVDKVGRRNLMLLLVPGQALAIGAFGALFYNSASPNKVLVMVLLLVYMAFNASGLQVVGWLLGSEMYPLGIRDVATSLHAGTLWGANILATSTLLSCVNFLGLSQTMWMYALLNIIGWIYVFFLVPETKGKSLESIEKSLKEGTFLPFSRKKI